MSPEIVNGLVVVILAAITAAFALLLRVRKQLDDDVRVTLMVPERHDRRFCHNHTRSLIRED